MNVLHINEHLARKGGVETYLLALLPKLRERGVESRILYGEGADSEHPGATRVPGIARAGFQKQGAVRREIQVELDRQRPDVIHIHNVQNIGVLQACLDYGATVMTSHDFRSICPASMFFYKRTREVCTRQRGPGCFTTTLTKHCLTPRPQYGLYFYYRTGWITKHASRFERVIAPSADAKDRLARAGFEPEQVVVMPYFCPVIPAEQPRPIPQTKTITFIGRMAPNKGGEYFIEALGKLPDSVQGIMVGNITDGSESDVRELARQHGCQNRLTLRRWASQDEIVHILNRTSVFVFPSLWPETLGIVGLEALARGVPVVASDIGGVREWLEDSVNGLLVEPGSAGQIHDAVIALVEDERKLFAYGEKGIETVNSKFLPAFHTEQLVRLYEQIVSNN